jgi:isoleucyl-tRNA synthetase
VALKGDAPYRASATNGWTLDGEGRALSKSKGAEEASKIINKYGADVMRLWTASVEFTEDVRLSDTILERLIEAYRKLRNTFKGVLGNLGDFDPSKDAVSPAEMLEVDQWILLRTEDLIRRCRAWYDTLEFHKVYRAIYDFSTTDLSALYIDVLKDRLYTAAPRSKARRSGQTALYRVHYALTRLAAPILAFTTEEIWGYTAKPADAPESVHLSLLPEPGEVTIGFSDVQRAKLAEWDKLMEVREPVLKALEEARQAKLIGKSLEARVRIAVPAADLVVLKAHASALPELFIVSQVELAQGELKVTVDRAAGEKCERCWKYSTAVGQDERFPTVCDTCGGALREMGL